MGSSESKPVPAFPPIAPGKQRICVAGYTTSHHTGRARAVAHKLATLNPSLFETWFYFAGSSDYYKFLKEKFDPIPFPDHLKGHASSPFVWIEENGGEAGNNKITPIGGRDHFCKWLQQNHADIVAGDKELQTLVTTGPSLWCEVFHDGKGAPQPTVAAAAAATPAT